MTYRTSAIVHGRNLSKQTVHGPEKIAGGHREVIARTLAAFLAKKSAKACAVSVERVGEDNLLLNNTEFKQCHRSLEFPAQLISLFVQ